MPERCPWCGEDPLYVGYHDTEWGVPVYDDRLHFEFLVLESAQAGLSWLTILRRREEYRRAYAGFNPETVAAYDTGMIEEMLQDKGLIRNRRKIEASVNNAHCFLEIQERCGSFSEYLWRFVEGKPVIGAWRELSAIPASTDLSDRVSRDLKQRGFQFMGPIIVYSHLQATGLVNDHLVSCFRFRELTGSLS
ncbi:MAG: DNA-3-methyladenine glycosylase I [Bacillota bacterium]